MREAAAGIAAHAAIHVDEAGAGCSAAVDAPRPRAFAWGAILVGSAALLAALLGVWALRPDHRKDAETPIAAAPWPAPGGVAVERAPAEPRPPATAPSGPTTEVVLNPIVEHMGAAGARSGSLTNGFDRSFPPPQMLLEKGWESRGFLSFDVSQIPAHASVVAAHLSCRPAAESRLPGGSGVTVVMDTIDIDTELGGGDFDRSGTVVARVPLDRFCSEPYDVTVPVVRAHAMGRGIVTFRFRFDPLPTTEGAWIFDCRPRGGTRLTVNVSG